MFRAPYSLNEKSWLASIPLSFSDLMSFSVESAKPENIKIREEFFKGEENEAEALLLDAMDLYASKKKERLKKKPVRKLVLDRKVSEEHFPPCIKLILAGLSDGKKRSIFTLVNFLRMMNWSWQEIEEKLFEWNSKNKPPLPRNTIISQLRWHQMQHRQINPANCANDVFYVSFGICRPDAICKQNTDRIVIKNPVVYPFKKIGRGLGNEYKKKFRGFSCDICNREFQTMRSLQLHRSRH